jgi:RNA polymerase sigma-70 factor (ECF subfamily)
VQCHNPARSNRAQPFSLALATDKELSDFLKSVEKRAFKRAVYAVRSDDAALDIVQDAMIRLATKYADRPLPNCRCSSSASCPTPPWTGSGAKRCAARSCRTSRSSTADDDGDFDLLETLHALEDTMGTESAADAVSRAQILRVIDAEVAELAGRQREAFLLRYWEEFDVAETAAVMGCSEGSVKTHCSRAVHALAKALRAKGITLMKYASQSANTTHLKLRLAARLASTLTPGLREPATRRDRTAALRARTGVARAPA